MQRVPVCISLFFITSLTKRQSRADSIYNMLDMSWFNKTFQAFALK